MLSNQKTEGRNLYISNCLNFLNYRKCSLLNLKGPCKKPVSTFRDKNGSSVLMRRLLPKKIQKKDRRPLCGFSAGVACILHTDILYICTCKPDMSPICVNYSYVPLPLQNYSSSHGLSGAKEELNRNLVCDTLHVVSLQMQRRGVS